MITVPDVVGVSDAMRVLPPYDQIPKEFKPAGWMVTGGTKKCFGDGVIAEKWLNLVDDWFFRGLKSCEWSPKPGVDAAKALRIVGQCMQSFMLSHEHKTAGCAYLLSEWFDDVKYETAK